MMIQRTEGTHGSLSKATGVVEEGGSMSSTLYCGHKESSLPNLQRRTPRPHIASSDRPPESCRGGSHRCSTLVLHRGTPWPLTHHRAACRILFRFQPIACPILISSALKASRKRTNQY